MNDLEQEILRLREALRAIDKVATSHLRGGIGIAQRIARAALASKALHHLPGGVVTVVDIRENRLGGE